MISDSKNHCNECIYQFLPADIEPCGSCDEPYSRNGDYFFNYKNFKSTDIFFYKSVVAQEYDKTWSSGLISSTRDTFQMTKKVEKVSDVFDINKFITLRAFMKKNDIPIYVEEYILSRFCIRKMFIKGDV